MSVTRNFFSFLFFFYSQIAASRWWSLASTFLFYLEYLALRTGGVGFGIPFDWCIRHFCIFFHIFPRFEFFWSPFLFIATSLLRWRRSSRDKSFGWFVRRTVMGRRCT
ncbi:hypothetical protein V8C43DRAFT_116702 [Trichoderma afarasin]